MNTNVVVNGGATSVLANDTDAENDTLMVDTTPLSGPSHGTLTLRSDGSFDYDHDGHEHFTDSFGYLVSDGSGATATATVTITITPVNDAPVATADATSVNGRVLSRAGRHWCR